MIFELRGVGMELGLERRHDLGLDHAEVLGEPVCVSRILLDGGDR